MNRRRAGLTGVDIGVGALMSLAALVHAGEHVRAGRPHDVLWICNVVALLVGPAVLLRSPLLSAVGLTWMVPGTLIWLLDAVLAGSAILPTSYGAHLGGAAVSVYAVRRNGHAPRGWVAALAVLLLVMVASWVALPPETNVNSVRDVPKGWEAFAVPGLPLWVGFHGLKVIVALACAFLGHVLGRAIARAAA
ncbi:MAG TPA: hypothetical protein VK459_06055 [Polyangiaceae bacterium]|nr:hypothetical protein [Polyangiaceae bacterium]